jgi:predicted ATPase/DNA-binding SARP family transcriptional activator
MRFGVLGPLAVWTDAGIPVTVPGAKVRTLLADLLVHQGQPVSTDRLVEDLWGGNAPANAAGAVQVRVSQLRKALDDAEPGGRELIASETAGYLVRLGPDTLDAIQFGELAARAAAGPDARTRGALLTEAVGLWRGGAFADFADEEFTRTAIARLEDQRLAVLEEHAQARLELGEYSLLAGELAELVARYPLRERLQAAHLRALYGAGRQSEALDRYAELRRRLADELGLAPGPELVALHRSILDQDPALGRSQPAAPIPRAAAETTPAENVAPEDNAPEVTRLAGPRRRTNLPAPTTVLVGRDDAVAQVREQLGQAGLVTLSGPGGVGKTRLALGVAQSLVDDYPDGVFVVESGGLDRPGRPDRGQVPAEAVLAVLEVRDVPGDPQAGPERLADAISGRRLLLVLDDCQHELAELAGRLLRDGSGLRVLATSREPLGVPGEVLVDVPPLPMPPAGGPGHGADSGAVRLFVTRATARGYIVDDRFEAAVARLCRRLDGIPLALDLAAGWVRSWGVDGLVQRLDERFRAAAGDRGRPPALLAMLDVSWQLLTGPERALLRRLAVLVGGFTLDAAEAIGGFTPDAADAADADARSAGTGDVVDATDVPDLLARLVDRSLVVAGPGARYRLPEPVAAYGADRLAEAGEAATVRARHDTYYTELAVRAERGLRGPDQQRWLRVLDADAANFRAALDGALDRGAIVVALRLTVALAWYRFLRGRLAEARRTLAAVLAAASASVGVEPELDALVAVASAWLAGFAILAGDTTHWMATAEAALAEIDDPGEQARAEWFLGLAGLDTGDLSASEALLDRAQWTFERTGDDWGLAAALATRAKLAHVRGDLTTLERTATRSAGLFQTVGDGWGTLQASVWLAGLAELNGDDETADRLHREGLRPAEELSLWPDASSRLARLGWIALQRGEYASAARCGAAALRLAVDHGFHNDQVLAEVVLGFARVSRTADPARLLAVVNAARGSGGLPAAAMQRADLARIRAVVEADLGPAFADEFDRGAGYDGFANVLKPVPPVRAGGFAS